MSKGIAVRVAALLVLATAGCEQSEVGDEPVATPRIHAMLNNVVQDWEGQDEFVRAFEEKTGARLEITQPPHQSYPERVLLQLASNSIPDVIEVLPEYLPRLVEEGLVIALDEFIAAGRHIGSVDPLYLESVRHPSGHIYGIPARDGGGCVTYIRKDWLEAVGLPVPTSFDELEEVMRAFTTGDPNRSGRNDTYAYTDVAGGSQDWYNRLALGAGRVEIYYDYDSGRWIDGFTTPATREGLLRLKRWYDEGLVDPDIATNTTFTARTKFINGQVGIFTYWANHWARNLQDRTAAADSPAAEILPLPPLEGTRYIRRVAPYLVLTGASEDPGTVFDLFIDRQFDRGEIQTLFTFGAEGYHWRSEDGRISFNVNPNDPYRAPFTRAYVPPGSAINGWVVPGTIDPLVARSVEALDTDPYYDRQRWGGPFFNQYYLEIEQRLKPEIITALVSGERSVDEAVAEYRLQAERLYLSRVLAELNEVSPAGEG